MPVPLPAPGEELRQPPDAAEARAIAGAVAAAVAPDGELTPLQRMMIDSILESMTGFLVPIGHVPRLAPEEFARLLVRRDELFRRRMVQLMMMCELVLVPLPPDVAARVEAYAHELSIDFEMLRLARRYATGSLGLALIDFERSGYTAGWDPAHTSHLHTTHALDEAWQMACDDAALAARWAALADCPDGSFGHAVSRFYAARAFVFPGLKGSAPPLLAQHDWVHVLADYGSTVESEIEVFAFISRTNDQPRAFSLLAMVISLFETGYLARGAGLFEYDRGHLSNEGMPIRLGDALLRGAMVANKFNGIDLLEVDWFQYADRPLEDVRAEFGLTPKAERAVAAGSVGPWEPGGISPYQYATAKAAAEAAGRVYDAFGASPPV